MSRPRNRIIRSADNFNCRLSSLHLHTPSHRNQLPRFRQTYDRKWSYVSVTSRFKSRNLSNENDENYRLDDEIVQRKRLYANWCCNDLTSSLIDQRTLSTLTMLLLDLKMTETGTSLFRQNCCSLTAIWDYCGDHWNWNPRQEGFNFQIKVWN